jgi:hypothetical protein
MTPPTSDTDKKMEFSTIYYILDPLLNIIYKIGTDVHWEPFKREVASTISYNSTPWWIGDSINFSVDNNSIYVAKPTYSGSNYTGQLIKKYKLNDNELTLIATNTYVDPNIGSTHFIPGGFVNRDGTITAPNNSFVGVEYPTVPTSMEDYTLKAMKDIDVISANGYYTSVYKYTTLVVWPGFNSSMSSDTVPPSTSVLPENIVNYWPVTIGKLPNINFYMNQIYTEPFLWFFHTPFNETIINNDVQWYYPFFWGHVDTDNILLQSFIMRKGQGDPVKIGRAHV